MTTLHYIFDPLCGWCYAAAPLVDAARTVPGLTVRFHGGGMMIGDARRRITPEWRGHVLPHDQRIAQLTGQPFSASYFDELLRDTNVMLDSEPPIAAVLAAEELAGLGLDLLRSLQRAHYVEARRIAELPVLIDVASGLGIDARAFGETFARLAGEPTRRHIADFAGADEPSGRAGLPHLCDRARNGRPGTF